MEKSEHYTEDDVDAFARVAGTTLSPENRSTIAANLSALRSGVLAKARTIPEDLGSARSRRLSAGDGLALAQEAAISLITWLMGTGSYRRPFLVAPRVGAN